jgi:zinc transport system permease protein
VTFDLIEYLSAPFFQQMLLAGILASLACGIIGSLVVVKRSVFIAGGISHTTFGGIGFAYWLQTIGLTWFDPLFGAIIFALGAALIMSVRSLRDRFREDSTIGMLWVLGMAAGIIFLQFVDPSVRPLSAEAILFGDILLVSNRDIFIILTLLGIIYAFGLVFFKDLKMLTFDEEYARISGVNTSLLNTLLMVLIALTVVILIKVVGVVLIIAMLTIPAATSNIYTKNLWSMMLLASILGVVLTTGGIFLSALTDLPPGAVIVMTMGSIFLISLLGKAIYSKVRSFKEGNS